MLVVDRCGVISYIQELAQTNFTCEHCAIAVAKPIFKENTYEYHLSDYCMIEDVGGITNDSVSTIPREVSYSLLNICKKTSQIPTIIHTHIFGYEYSMPVNFSPQDMCFIEKFAYYATKLETISDCLFIVTNGIDTTFCKVNLDNMDYYFQEERSDE